MERLRQLAESPFLLVALARERRMSGLRRAQAAYGTPLLLLVGPAGLTALATQDAAQVQGALLFTAFLVILAVAVRAAAASAHSVVGERQRGTLVSLALTRIDSAEYADGIALAAAYPLLRAGLVLTPLTLLLGWLAGGGVLATLMVSVICLMVTVVFAYCGLLVSATSRTVFEATSRVWTRTLALFFGTPILFFCGGFVAYPLWLLHPYFAFVLALWGAAEPGPTGAGLLYLRWYALLFVPLYLALARTVRRTAISALERIPLT